VRRLTIDFESSSVVTDLNRTGPWPYWMHPSTQVLCVAFKPDGAIPWLWFPGQDIGAVNYAIERADQVIAHNVQFELAGWHCKMVPLYGAVPIPFHKVRCSSSLAAMYALPRSLDGACSALGLPVQKDKAGHALMLKMCKPRAPRKAEWTQLDAQYGHLQEYQGLRNAYHSAKKDKLLAMCYYAMVHWTEEFKNFLLWHESPEELQALGAYCLQDVEAEHALVDYLGELPPMELEVFRHDIIINTRGVQIDTGMVANAIRMIREYENRLLLELEALTGGAVRSPKQVAASKSWLAAQGVHLDTLDKAAVAAALKLDLPEHARRFLEIRRSLAKSSTAKYEAARRMTCQDGRLRGFAMYHGAATGRFTGKGMQLQNLPRGIFDLEKDEDARNFWEAVEMVRAGNLDQLIEKFGDPMPVLSSLIRPVIIARHGHYLIVADFSAIEGRGLAWIAGEEWVLDAYRAYDRGEGPDMYMVTAGKILGKDPREISKKERKSPGKIADLACGYYGGVGAIDRFGGKVPEEEKARWTLEALRELNRPGPISWAPGYVPTPEERERAEIPARAFSHLEAYLDNSPQDQATLDSIRAARWPMPADHEVFEAWAGDVVRKWRKSRPETVKFWKGVEAAAIKAVQTGAPQTYGKVTFAMDRVFLTCTLPSGRRLFYPFPKILSRETKWGVRSQLSAMTVDAETKQWVRRFLHGGILTENIVQALCRDILVEAMLRLEAHGFPIVLHVHDEAGAEVPIGARSLEEFKAIMTQVPQWAAGFPISAAGWVGERYRKD